MALLFTNSKQNKVSTDYNEGSFWRDHYQLPLTNVATLVLLLTDDLTANKVPANFKKLLGDKFRDYGESETHRQAYVYFATRISPAVNTSFNKFDKSKYKKKVSESFSGTDEAFALLLVINYEPRWQSQHDALMEHPLESRKSRERRWKEAKYTSSAEGRRRGDVRR